MKNPWITGGLRREGIVMMTTDRRAMGTVAMVIGTKWSFLGRGKIAAEARTGACDRRVEGTGRSTTEAEPLPGTGAGIAAGTQKAVS